MNKLNEKLIETKKYSEAGAIADGNQIQQMMDDVRGVSIGAIQRFSEQPLLRASL